MKVIKPRLDRAECSPVPKGNLVTSTEQERLRVFTRQPQCRSGAILICVMACMAVSGALVALSVKNALLCRRECQRDLERRQLSYVLDAGIKRALVQLEQEAGYRGETWRVPKSVIGSSAASIEIQVSELRLNQETAESPTDGSVQRRVSVIVGLDDPVQSLNCMQLSHAFVLDESRSDG